MKLSQHSHTNQEVHEVDETNAAVVNTPTSRKGLTRVTLIVSLTQAIQASQLV